MFLQILANGIAMGCNYALVGLGFAVIYSTTRIFHFAHGAIIVGSAYCFYFLYHSMNMLLVPAVGLSLVFGSFLGILIDELGYQPLSRRRHSSLSQLLTSLGIYIIIVNIIAGAFGSDIKILRMSIQPSYTMFSVSLSRLQLMTIVGLVVSYSVVGIVLIKTPLGIMLQALRDDRELLEISGVNPNRIRRFAFALGSALAGLAGLLQGSDVGIDPFAGMPMLLSGAVAMIIGGEGIVFEGVVLGGLILGVMQGLAVWKIASKWEPTITFTLLIFFLLVRPQGIIPRQVRLEESQK